MKWLKVGAVVFFAVAITALGIDAADTLNGSRSTLLGQIVATETGACPDGMVEVPQAETFDCVDIFEAAPDSTCPHKNTLNQLQSQENLNDSSCAAISQAGTVPWRFINRAQAQTACLRAGKRLIKSEEWYLASAGTPDSEVCNVSSGGVKETGSSVDCQSAIGIKDAVGNVWEWTSDDVINGVFNSRSIPEAGYVSEVDGGGFPTMTELSPPELYGKDYFWSSTEGAFGVMRGGFYGSKDDAGTYSVHAETKPSVVGGAIGFRCVI